MKLHALSLVALPALFACGGQLSDFTSGELAVFITNDVVSVTAGLYQDGGCSSYDGLSATINGDDVDAEVFANGGGLFPGTGCAIDATLDRTVPPGADDESVEAQFSAGEESVVLKAEALVQHPTFVITTPPSEIVPGATIAVAIEPPVEGGASGFIDSEHLVTMSDSGASFTLPATEPVGPVERNLQLDAVAEDCTGLTDCTASLTIITTLSYTVVAP